MHKFIKLLTKKKIKNKKISKNQILAYYRN